MFNHLHYVPILKSKRAEFVALGQLAADIKTKLTPMIEVITVPWDFAKDLPRKTLKSHIDGVIEYIAKSWPNDLPMFLDLLYVASRNEIIADKHCLIYCFEALRVYKQMVIPVTNIDRDENYQEALKSILRKDKRGLCVRIQQTDLDDLDNLSNAIDTLLGKFDLAPNDCDIVLDFQALPLQEVSDPVAYISNIIRTFPNIKKWHSFTVAASNFPKIPAMVANSTKLISREEFIIWNEIIKNGRLPKLPSFGDYAIQHPDLEDVDFRTRKIPVSLRYATPTQWLVYKGREKNKFGHAQFNKICSSLVKSNEYCGASFSEGDSYISRCAKNSDGPGRPEEWRRAGFNHHMTLVVKQLSNFGEP
ncbi:MAG: hypothetical protein FD156_780 [Nitrospirae bacterium]|nr:MAG: hypothetical protein FD156_780 [Nitrospirota bacterium]